VEGEYVQLNQSIRVKRREGGSIMGKKNRGREYTKIK